MRIRLLIIAAVLAVCGTAQARWKAEYANSPYQTWFSQQHNAKGQWCCDEADGHRYDGGYEINADGSVTLADGRKIESWKVLTGSNPTGHAILWTLGSETRCFAIGTLG